MTETQAAELVMAIRMSALPIMFLAVMIYIGCLEIAKAIQAGRK